jgi:hypothetical protein
MTGSEAGCSAAEPAQALCESDDFSDTSYAKCGQAVCNSWLQGARRQTAQSDTLSKRSGRVRI